MEVEPVPKLVRRDGGRVEVVAAAAKLLGDMEAMGTHIGLDPNQSTVPD